MPPYVDSTSLLPVGESDVPSGTATAVLPKPAPTIAAAPTGVRAQRVRELLERTAACTEPVEQQRLRRLVVTEYLPVARSLASRYSGRGVERNDLEQLAFLGLVKAVRRWEPGRSEDFLQFAVPTIVGEIKRYFRDHSWLVRPPRRIQELRAAINDARSRLVRLQQDDAPLTLATAHGIRTQKDRRLWNCLMDIPASIKGSRRADRGRSIKRQSGSRRFVCTEEGTRTLTTLRLHAPETCASTNSATPVWSHQTPMGAQI